MNVKNYVVKKEGSNVKEIARIMLCDPTPYITKNENCLKEFIDFSNKYNINIDQIKLIERNVESMIISVSKLNDGYKIDQAINMVKNIRTKDDVVKIVKMITDEYNSYIVDSIPPKYHHELNKYMEQRGIEKGIDTTSDIFMSIIIKKLIMFYYERKIEKLGINMINILEDKKDNGSKPEELITVLNEEFSEISKNNGVYELSLKVFYDTIDTVYDRTKLHLCWQNCENASPANCPKVWDETKQKINKYEFINSGLQIFDLNGNLDRFVVTDCSKYINSYHKRLKNNK